MVYGLCGKQNQPPTQDNPFIIAAALSMVALLCMRVGISTELRMVCQELIKQKKMERLQKRLSDVELKLMILQSDLMALQRETRWMIEMQNMLSEVLEWHKLYLKVYGKARNNRRAS